MCLECTGLIYNNLMYHFFFRLLTAKGAMESVEDKYTGLNECHQLMIEEHNAKEANFNAEINTKDQVTVYSGTSLFQPP